ncbi:DMT family transporter [Pseudooceanicola nanhaiensis]|uniref:DMT family transporter n=1 Tax=Pseudooceanicola nanhaiensis TaxID=375761 RepID=UPI001CD5260E|nr:DMT family transporter [Pseudooceanicola nanhaiensis]MCA0922118.1 DMT family transporter [Pseudooceanicola nanhaiensis]
MQDIPRRSWLMVAILGFVWGTNFSLIEVALTGFTPFWLATLRLTLAGIITGVLWQARGGRLTLDPEDDRRTGVITYLWLGAIGSAMPFLLLGWGQQHVTSSFAGTAMAAVPLFVLPLAHVFVPGERMHLRRVIGVLMGVAGVWVLMGGGPLSGSGSAMERWGQLACLGVAACYAVNSISIRRLPPHDPIGLTTVMALTAALTCLPLALLFEPLPTFDVGLKPLLALLSIAVVSTAAMNLLRVLVIRDAGPTFLTLVNYQVPIWSVLAGSLLLAEPLPASLLGALALILAGVALSQVGALKRLFTG